MTTVQSLTYLLIASVALLLAMGMLVSARKVLRDRREARSRVRVAALRETLARRRPRRVRATLRRLDGVRAELDFVRVMDGLLPTLGAERLELIQEAAIASRFVSRYRRRFLEREPWIRGRAVLVLTRLRLPDTIDDLRHMLADADADVRLTACAGIAVMQDPRGVPVLLDAVAHGWLQPERVIERIGQPWAVDALMEELERRSAKPDRDGRTIVGIARALGAAGDPRAEPPLLALLAQGSDEERISAARALGAIGAAFSVAALVAALEDPCWPLRAQAAKSLGALKAPEAIAALERALTDHAWWVRANAASALAGVGAPGIHALRQAAESEDRYARDRARETLSLLSVPDRERADEPAVGVLAIAERGAPAPAAAPVGAA